MKKLITILLVSMLAVSMSAEAGKRLGGGKSVGQQSTNVTKKQAAPAQATPPAATPAPAPSRPWGAMLGGLAAGLGLAWLASSLGMGEAFANIMLALLIGMVVLAAVGWFMRRRMINNSDTLAYQAPQINAQVDQPLRFAGDPISASSPMSGATWTIPAGFDVPKFEAVAKQNFTLLQGAWDRADMATLGNMMTDTMLKETQQQLARRDSNEDHRTAVISVSAKLLGIEETATSYMASVEYSGIIQETVGADPQAFEEVWNMTKSKTSGGWVLAGIQHKD